MPRGRVSLSITLSKEVAEALDVFKNKSKLIDSMLSYLLLDLSKEEVFELLTNKNNDVVMYLIKRKCRELNGTGGIPQTNRGRLVVEVKQTDKSATPHGSDTPLVIKKPKINPQDFWG